jgi:signal transduction histidine kinase
MNIINISLTIVSLVTAGLSLFIIRGENNRKNKVFSLFILSISLWSAGLLFFVTTSSLDVALNYTRFYYIMAAAIPAFFLHFSFLFPKEDKVELGKWSLIYLPLVIISAGLLIEPNLIISDIYISKNAVKLVHLNIANYIIYTVYFISYLLYAYKKLFNSFFTTDDKSVKLQLKFIFIGTIFPYILAMFFDLILPPFDYSYVWVGPLFAFVVVCVLLYAIYKHHLLNAKVIAVELLTISLWAFILIRILLSGNDQDKIVNIILLIVTVIIGILLIKNVRHEVTQREKIEFLAENLKQANVRLLELDKQKSEFVSFATHQLRAPLTAMKGYSSLILEGDLGEINKNVRDAIGRILESSKTLAVIVDDYLNISRIELGAMKYAFEIMDLKDLTENVIGELKPNVEGKGLGISFNSKVGERYMVRADKGKIKQVISNLIDNAVKYTPSGSVKVSIIRNTTDRKILLSIVESILCLLNVIIDVFNALIVVDRSCTGAACTGSPSEFTHINQLAI